jgi:murein endopeptidase
MRSLCLCGVLTLLACFGGGEALAQDTAAEEVVRRAMTIAELPPDAAKVMFGRENTPTAGPPQAIGSYDHRCLSGAIALPADGPNWHVMRPSRNRVCGHPVLIAFLERLARKLAGEVDWPRLLVGDMAQPRGGPMLTGTARTRSDSMSING